MGTGQSTTRRRVQPSLPYSLHYHRLPPTSSTNSVSEPLLSHMVEDDDDDDEEEEVKDDSFYQQINCEKTEAIRSEKNNAAALEKEICVLRSKVSSLESNLPPSKALVKQILEVQAHKKKFEATEKEVAQLKSKVYKLESKSFSTASSSKQETVIENLKRKNAELEKKIMELTTSVDKLKHHTLNSAGAVIIAEPQGTEMTKPRSPGPKMNDLIGCLMILIFLVSILIGINL